MNTIDETKEVKTPSGEHVLLVRNYLTGEDRRENRRFILKLNEDGKSATVEGIEEAENFLLKKVILEIDGKKENVIDTVLKMRSDDYDFVVELVNEVSSGLSKKKEKISNGSTDHTLEEPRLD